MMVQGHVVRDGRDCVELAIPGRSADSVTRMVVDPSRGYAPVDIVDEYRGDVTSHLTIDYVADNRLGWRISEWEVAHFGGERGQATLVQRGKVLRYSINRSLDEKIFQFDFPPGAEVTDYTGPRERRYVVPKK
jgi:hypothetical protein